MTVDRWTQRRIGDFAQRLKRVNVEGLELEPLSVTKGSGVILQSEKYNKRIATDLRKYVIAEDGDFAFDPMSLYYGSIGRVDGIGRGVVSPDYVVFGIDATVDGSFLNFVLRHPNMHRTYDALAEGGNQFGKRRRVYWSIFENIEVSLPPINEQRKIAAILSSVDAAIETTQAVIDQLQVVKKAMMGELLTRGLSGRHTQFKQTEIGELPEEWHVVPVDEAGLVDAGKARDPRAVGTPKSYLRVANVLDGEIRVDDVLTMPFGITEFLRYQLNDGDILLNEGQSIDLVGRCSIYHGELGQPCAFQNTLLRFRPRSGVVTEFAEQYFRWCQQTGRFAELATQTTSIAHLGLRRFASMLMAVPARHEQERIASTLGDIDRRCILERYYAAELNALRSALMSALLTGEIRVTPDEAAP